MNQELYPDLPILIVDDDKNFLCTMETNLKTQKVNHVKCCQDSLEVMARLEKNKYSIILLDMKMAGISGEKLLPKIVKRYPGIPIIAITGYPDTKIAVECMKCGAFDYLIKPFETKELIESIKNALDKRDDHKEILLLKMSICSEDHRERENFPSIITQSEEMNSIFETIGLIAPTPKPVLICGETGVGKELIAREIHKKSRQRGDFIAINSAGRDDQLFSDELFGHKKGAFTGAFQDRKGLVEMAAHGTLFLDEIGDISLESQRKLLRLIEEGEYFRLGDDKVRYSKARIVTATNRKLNELMETKEFRDDLYYRLQMNEIHIPPLRERKEDIKPLLEHFMEQSAEELKKRPPAYPKELLGLLEGYHFPGNIRELKNMVYSAVIRHKRGILSLDVFWEKIENNRQSNSYVNSRVSNLKERKVMFGEILPTFSELELIYMDELMKRSGGNISQAARWAGLERKTFTARLKKIGYKYKKEK